MRKALTQKNTLLKNAQANAASNFFKRVFFSPTQEEFFPTQILFYFFSPTHGFPANTTSCASNVNRFGQTVSELQTVELRTNSRAAHNIRLKEILKRRALYGNQTVVLLTGRGALTNSGASNPFFLKLL
jgi:cytolysin (calcineurin-like family phosphatase)